MANIFGLGYCSHIHPPPAGITIPLAAGKAILAIAASRKKERKTVGGKQAAGN